MTTDTTTPPITRRLGAESALTFGGIVVNAALAFAVTWMVAHGLGAGATGRFFRFTSWFTIAMCAVCLGTDTALMRFVARYRAQGRPEEIRPVLRTALVPVIVTGLLGSAAVYLAAPALVDGLHLDPCEVPMLRVLAAALLPAALTGTLLGASRGLDRIRTYTVVQNLLIPIARAAAVALAVYLLHDAGAVVGGWALPLLLAALVAALVLARHLRADVGPTAPVPPARSRPLRREFWAFSLPRAGTAIVERVLDWGDVLIVLALAGPVTGGVYGVVSRIVQAGNMLESALRIVMGPRLSAALALEDRAAARTLYTRVTVLLIRMSWPFYLTVAVWAGPVLSLFGPEFVAGGPALVVLCGAMLLRTTVGALQTVLLMAGRSSWQLRNKLVQLLTLVVLTCLLVPSWGLMGGAVAFAISTVVDTVLAAGQVHARLGLSTAPGPVARAAALPVLVGLGGGLACRLLLTDTGTLPQLAAAAGVVGIHALLLFLPSTRPSTMGDRP